MRTFGQNLATLAKRAALTIPLWFALRRGIGAIFRTIKDGIKNLVEFDKALQKAKRNLQGTPEEIERNFGTLQAEVSKLSFQTGRSVEDITNAFQKFATVGFDFETSMAGAINATKLSILLFGDATETANAFARTMRVLIDETDGAKPASQQLAEVMALTSELWKTNAFELNELTASLVRFAPAAKVAGFSAGESVKLMAGLSTAGLRGSKAGRLLSTSLTRLLVNTDKLAASLGIKVNPEVDRTYDVFLRVLDALEKTRNTAGKVSPEFEKITKSIFGLRSGLAVKGLVALRKNLQAVLGTKGDVSEFNEEFKKVNDSVFQLSARFKNLNKEMGKAFVNGIIGAENFQDSLLEVVQAQERMLKGMEKFGGQFRNTIIAGMVGGISLLTLKYGGLIALLATPLAPAISTGIIALQLLNFVDTAKRLENQAKDTHKDFLKIGGDLAEQINKGFRGQLSLEELELLIARIETIGKEQLKTEIGSFDRTVEELKKARDILKDIGEEKDRQTEKEEESNENELKKKKISEIILKNELAILRLKGASTAQILKTEEILRKSLNLEKSATEQLDARLALQRAINSEKELENSLSSRTKKLAEIARTEGVASARRISEVLSGEFDFDIFERIGGKNLDIFKKEFGDIFKEQKDIKFLQGKGFSIIPAKQDRALIRGDTERKAQSKASLALNRAESQVKSIEKSLLKTELNTGATINNTSALDKLRLIFQAGGTITGQQVLGARKTDSTIKIDLNIGGSNLTFKGTPEEIKASASRMAPEIIPILERAIAHTLRTNNNADISKAVDERTDKF